MVVVAWLARPVMAAAAALLAGLLAVSRPRAPAVPLVNLTALALGDAAELAVLKHATRSLGVFRVVGHGVDGASVINASKALFALPLDAKLATSASAAGGAFQRGYIPLGSESGLADYFEVKEGFCYGHAWGKGEYPEGGWPNNLTGANSWPDEMHGLGGGWRATLEGFFDASARLAARLTAELPRALGHRALGQQPPQPPPPQRPPPQRPAQPGTAAPAGAEGAAEGSGAEGAAEGSGAEGAAEGSGAEGAADWAALCEGGEPISIMRLFHYFAATHRPELAAATPRTGSSPHTDWHMLTVILQDQQGGLQVLDQGGSWIDVPAIQGELTILLGDYLHWLSAGETVSPIHRVLLPPAGAERYSFTYFAYPSYAARVPPDVARRAAWRRRRRRRRGVPSINTLTAEGAQGERMLTERPFGEILEDKWRGVASNKLAG